MIKIEVLNYLENLKNNQHGKTSIQIRTDFITFKKVKIISSSIQKVPKHPKYHKSAGTANK